MSQSGIWTWVVEDNNFSSEPLKLHLINILMIYRWYRISNIHKKQEALTMKKLNFYDLF